MVGSSLCPVTYSVTPNLFVQPFTTPTSIRFGGGGREGGEGRERGEVKSC